MTVKISDGQIKRIAEMVCGLAAEIRVVQIMPAFISEQVIGRNVSILYSTFVTTKACGIRHKVLELARDIDPDIYGDLVAMCDSYDGWNSQELQAEMQGDLKGIKEAQTAIEKIMSK